ncbi:MAG: NAD(P)(+) transhydrogenase (Re/Si-specific) subunit beta [Lentisphaeria bacterium]|nr:NAD(P)(+) transhydrogenase (Re/Si-specific) subunit beta [Lentisphaeria bacterium]
MDKAMIINLAYIAASILFITGLKRLSSPATARQGNAISALGMLIAIIAVLCDNQIISFQWIIVGIIAGSIIGAFAAKRVEMTGMPELVALFNGFGGISSLLLGWSEFHKLFDNQPSGVYERVNNLASIKYWESGTLAAIILAVVIGGITFTGSLIAWAKLSEKINSKAFVFSGQKVVNAGLLGTSLICGILFCYSNGSMLEYKYSFFIAVAVLSLILGVLAVISIGGGDMPVVISLLNSYSGLAACAAGFVIQNNVLIVAGALVGASGLILTNIMCKAMNRSLANVLFSGFGSATTSSSKKGEVQGEAKPIVVSDAYLILEAAQSVLFVPGYGMAVAQAQHAVRELGELLDENGCDVKYGIHPVAGRMPGHMNVLLAEANVSYDLLVEPDDVNPTMEMVDVCVVIGANDVVNPDARDDESSPIYGMPIIEVDKARTVFVLKRSMSSGFAGVQNPLFFNDNTRMLFGDAKASISGIVAEFKGE